MNRAISTFSATAGVLVACSAAAGLDYKFSGTVTTVPAALASQFEPGEIVSGRMTIVPTVFLPNHGGGEITDFTANIGGNYPITANMGIFTILNDFGGSVDQVKLDITPSSGLVAPPVSGHAAEYFFFLLHYRGTNPLTSSNFLPQFIFPNAVDRSGLRFDGNDELTVRFRLTDLSLVPEPSAMFLAVSSIALLAQFGLRGVATLGKRS